MASAIAVATPPLTEIVVTPENERQTDFSVLLVGPDAERSLIVYAPRYTNRDCTPSLSGTELRTKDGRLVYSQTVDMGPTKYDPEIRGEIREPTYTLTLWINYLCPANHIFDGARYIFTSTDWEKSGRMR